VAAAEYPIAI